MGDSDGRSSVRHGSNRHATLHAPPAPFGNPSPDAALPARGRERYEVFRPSCHGGAGDGTGLAVQRGGSRPLSFHTPRSRAAPAEHRVGMIANGKGRMPSYAVQGPPAARRVTETAGARP
ncbi:c-type cytochrome [Methylobacterium sp. ID0610]|uniref:c-type cytochrome n=1 Tax=Methylobacterium carpenticola TaxID=3344827 RepID=UPI0036C1CC25